MTTSHCFVKGQGRVRGAVADHARVHLGVHHLDGGHRLEQPEHLVVQQLSQLELTARRQERSSHLVTEKLIVLQVGFLHLSPPAIGRGRGCVPPHNHSFRVTIEDTLQQ